MRKLVVFPNDPILAYYKKGEIKARYFNPGNYFDEVHFISTCYEEVKPDRVQELVGDAKLEIHTVGTFSKIRKPWLFFTHRQRVLELVKNIAPSASRGFNLRYGGYLAAYCARELGIPSLISLHADYSRWRNFRILGRDYIPWPLIYSLMDYPLERYIIKHADLIIGAYEYPLKYVKKHRNRGLEVVYNKVYTDRYGLSQKRKNERPVILSVARQHKGRSPENLIRAVKDLDVTLLLIGSGELTPGMKKLASELGLSEKVKFIESVPNSQIHEYYLASDIFAISTQYPGINITCIEAMAAALPVVTSRSLFEKERELVADIAIVVENTHEAFEEAFRRLLADSQLRKEMGKKGRKRALEINGEIMERKEVELYKQLVEKG
ncbi:glycosyltransferase family 4 protein [Chloroflexota bacterium]